MSDSDLKPISSLTTGIVSQASEASRKTGNAHGATGSGQPVSEYLQDQAPRSSTGSTELPMKWIAAIFAKLQAQYGQKWTSQWKGDKDLKFAMKEWSIGLSRLNPDDIKRAFETWEGDWPPSMREFCRAAKPHRYAYHKLYRGLPRPPDNPEVRARELARIREILGGPRKPET